jgi:hypothetical protein
MTDSGYIHCYLCGNKVVHDPDDKLLIAIHLIGLSGIPPLCWKCRERVDVDPIHELKRAKAPGLVSYDPAADIDVQVDGALVRFLSVMSRDETSTEREKTIIVENLDGFVGYLKRYLSVCPGTI